jgi:hypothetical protein
MILGWVRRSGKMEGDDPQAAGNPMHAPHEAIVSRPVFCKLADLFALLDRPELRDQSVRFCEQVVARLPSQPARTGPEGGP